MALTMRAKQPKRGVVACDDGFIEDLILSRGDKAERSLIQVMDIQKPSKQEKLHTHWIMK